MIEITSNFTGAALKRFTTELKMLRKKKLDTNKVLDHVIRLERRRKIRNFSIIGAFILIFGAMYSTSVVLNHDPVKFSKEVAAVIQNVEETERGNQTLSVKLPSKEVVSFTIAPNGQEYSVEQSIQILEEELANGQMRYSLVSE